MHSSRSRGLDTTIGSLQWRRQGRRLKNEFIFYLRISRLSQVIYFVYHNQNYRETKFETQRKISRRGLLHVLQTTQNLIILRRCFAEDGKEMYQEL